ncbi:hypothetical protein IFM89_006951, partial [Coptis chinensis]
QHHACLDVIEEGDIFGSYAGVLKKAKVSDELVLSSTSKGLVHAFFAQCLTSKVPGVTDVGLKPRQIKKVAVIGGGLMGSGIATALVLSNISVVLKEINPDYQQKGMKTLQGCLWKAMKILGLGTNSSIYQFRISQIEINEIVARDPSSKYKDLDHDTVAEVFGKDGRGRVLGLGSGVSKTTLIAVAPYKRTAKEAERSKLELQSQMNDLKQEVIEGKRTQMEMQSQVNALLTVHSLNQGVQTRISTNSTSDQTTGHSLSRQPMVLRSIQTCEVQSIGVECLPLEERLMIEKKYLKIHIGS